jgi:hypothetical protein
VGLAMLVEVAALDAGLPCAWLSALLALVRFVSSQARGGVRAFGELTGYDPEGVSLAVSPAWAMSRRCESSGN